MLQYLSKQRRVLCNFPGCDKKFTEERFMKSHYTTVHANNSKPASLTRVVNNVPKRIRLCIHCNEGNFILNIILIKNSLEFASWTKLTNHVCSAIPATALAPTYPCFDCKEVFNNSEARRSHLRRYNNHQVIEEPQLNEEEQYVFQVDQAASSLTENVCTTVGPLLKFPKLFEDTSVISDIEKEHAKTALLIPLDT